MKLNMFLTADYANVDQPTGKFNVTGAFTRIIGNSFPLKHRRMYIAVSIRAELTDHHDQRILAIDLKDDDGNELFHMSGPVRFPHTGTGLPGQLSAVIELNELVFPHPGFYHFEVYVDHEQLESAHIELVQAQSNPG